MFPNNYIVIEGTHKNPNDILTIDIKSKKIYGPFTKDKAEKFAKSLIQKNVDDFYHRAWVIENNSKVDDICEECQKKDESVTQNLIMHGFKICNSCKISKTIFPI